MLVFDCVSDQESTCYLLYAANVEQTPFNFYWPSPPTRDAVLFFRLAGLRKKKNFPPFLFSIHLNFKMAQQAKQAAQRLGGLFPQGSGKGAGSAAGALVVLGALGYGINASLFNGNDRKKVYLVNVIFIFICFSRRWSQSCQVYSSFWCPKRSLL